MIKLYAGTSDRGTYDHVGIDGGGIFKEIVTESKLHRPPGAARAWVERLDSAQRETFQVTFGVKADTEAEALNLITALRYKLNYVTKLEHVETGLTRNLPGNRANVAHYDPVPRHSKFKGVWYSNFVLRLAEGNWQGYTSFYDPVPDPVEPVIVECGSDFVGFATQVAFEGEWGHTPADANFDLTDAGENAYILFTRDNSDGAGYLYPTACEQATRKNSSYSVKFKFELNDHWFHSAGVMLRVGNSPTGYFSGNDALLISAYRGISHTGKLYIWQRVSSVGTTLLDALASATIAAGVEYELYGDVLEDQITYTFKNLDTNTVIDSGSVTTTLTTSGYSGFYGEVSNDGDQVHLLDLSLRDYGLGISPDPETGTSDPVYALPALGDFQPRGGEGALKVAYSQFTKPYTARNRDFDSAHPSKFLHPSTGAMNKPTSGSSPDYFFCEFEVFEITDRDAMTIVSRGSSGFGNSTYDRHIQWSFIHESHYYGVRNGDLMKATSLGLPVVICSRARVLSELGLTAYDSQAVRWGGPSEGLIVSDNTALGKEIAGGYVRTGLKTVVFFAYNVTDNQILSTTQEITFTTEAELYFDFISMSIKGGYLYVKPRKQGSSLSVDYWVFPITLSGVGSRVLVDLDVGHFSAGLMLDSGSYTDAMFTFFDEVFKLVDPSDGSILLTKAVEGKWNRHIGYVYGTHGFTTYDDNGFAAFEFSDGSGGYGLGDGWTGEAYVQMSVRSNGDVFVLGQQGGIPEVRYFKNE